MARQKTTFYLKSTFHSVSTAKLIFEDHIKIHHWAKACNFFDLFHKFQCEHKSTYVHTVSTVVQLWIIMPLKRKDKSTLQGPIKSCVSATNDLNLLCWYMQKRCDSSGYRGDSWRRNSAFDGEHFFRSSISGENIYCIQIVHKTCYKYFMNLLFKIIFFSAVDILCRHWNNVGLKLKWKAPPCYVMWITKVLYVMFRQISGTTENVYVEL
jgi:hypothetical protein